MTYSQTDYGYKLICICSPSAAEKKKTIQSETTSAIIVNVEQKVKEPLSLKPEGAKSQRVAFKALDNQETAPNLTGFYTIYIQSPSVTASHLHTIKPMHFKVLKAHSVVLEPAGSYSGHVTNTLSIISISMWS